MYVSRLMSSLFSLMKISIKKLVKMFCKPAVSKIEDVKLPFLVVVGFCIGVVLNQFGVVMEDIRVHVHMASANEDADTTLQQLLIRLPHLNTSSAYLVPNIVHYFWFTEKGQNMTFLEYLSVLSVQRIQKPDAIWFHSNQLPDPQDNWWVRIWQLARITIVHHNLSTGRENRNIKLFHDMAVVEALLHHGGIYLNWNVLTIQNLNHVRNFSTFLCKDSDGSVRTDMILATRNSVFMQKVSTVLQSEHKDLAVALADVFTQHPELVQQLDKSFCTCSSIDSLVDWKSLSVFHIPHSQWQMMRVPFHTDNNVLFAMEHYFQNIDSKQKALL